MLLGCILVTRAAVRVVRTTSVSQSCSAFSLGRELYSSAEPVVSIHTLSLIPHAETPFVPLKMSSVDDVVDRPPIIGKDAIDSSDAFLVTQLEKTSGSEAADGVAILLSQSRRPDAEKELLRRLDLRLLPTLFLIYILNSIDVCAFSLTFNAFI